VTEPLDFFNRKAQTGPMTKSFTALFSIAILALCLAGCGTFGSSPSAPTPLEKTVFTTITNYQVVVKNVVIPVYQTNNAYQLVTITNTVGQVVPMYVTNTLIQTAWQTNAVLATNATYTLSTSPGTVAAVQGGAAIVNAFAPGIGTIASGIILALFGGWSYLRGSKQGDTSAALAQEVETLRGVLQSLPNGAKYDTVITSWLQSHQVEAGVATQVLKLLKDNVSSPDAKSAVQGILDTYAGLTATPAPPAAPKV